MVIWAVVPAGGSGLRMRAGTPKQYLPLGGDTVIEHALAPFIRNPHISGIVVVISPEDCTWSGMHPACDKPLVTAAGGATRADSVLSGLDALSATLSGDAWVLVHDAVRPCLRDADLARFIDTLSDDPVGGLLAVKAQDTLKQARGQRVEATLDRGRVWQAQTPQMFRLDPLAEALRAAIAAGYAVTDEASAMEWKGLEPRLVEGRADNIKVTCPADLAMAAHILARRAMEEDG